MAYIKNTWVDQEVERPKTYEMVNNSDGSVTLVDSFGLVSELGTPVNADNMNHIEDGIGEHEDRITILEEGQDTSNFLNKSQITNCLLEVPQRIKLELNNGTLTLKAGSKVTIPNGAGKFEELVLNSDRTTSSTAGTNQKFIFIKQDGSLIIGDTITQTGSGTTDSFAGQAWHIWYDTTNNKIVRYTSNATTPEYQISFPIALVTAVDGVVTSIDQVFNGYGYIGRHAWFDKGIKCIFGIKRNPDGTIENKELTTNFYVWETHNWTEGRLVHINENGTHTDIMPARILKGLKSEMPSEVSMSSFHLYICTDTLEVFYTSTKVANWQPQPRVVPIFEYGAVNPNDGNTLTYFKPYQTFRAVDYNEIRSIPHVVNRYTNGASWYRVWSDGWIEQGGVTTDTSGTITYNLLKSYSNTNYTLTFGSVSSGSSSGGGAFPSISAKTASSFSIHYDYYTTNKNKGVNWHACGY